MDPLIEYLKGPQLVIEVQKFFGIEYVTKPKSSPTKSNGFLGDNPEANGKKNGLQNHQSNGKLTHRHENGQNQKHEENTNDETEAAEEFIVHSKFWHYLFLIGTELGDELFYASFIPFWFWNVDSAVGRRVVFLWAIVMYIGQGSKEIIRWPRPGPPVIRLQKKWAVEYGMPSTHAMCAVSMPFSVLIFTLERYKYPAYIGIAIAVIWCFVICVSRVYLGMHNVLDVLVGIAITVFMMLFLVPFVDYADDFIVTSKFSPLAVLFISIMLIVYHPLSDKWTPTRGDTTMTISVTSGIQLAAWINYQMGYYTTPSTPPPYDVIWPTYQMLGLLLLRTVLGFSCLLATRAIAKSISYAFVCAILGKDKNELRNSENSLENKKKIIVELCYKYFTYGMIGFNTQFLFARAFKLLEIGRPDFYTEI